MLRKINTSEQNKIYKELFDPYLQTLSEYGDIGDMNEEYFADAVCNNMDVYVIAEQGEDMGVAIAQKVGKAEGFPEDMFYIADFGISDPENRRKGIGRRAFRELTESVNTPVFLYVFPGNYAALAFWRQVLTENGFAITPACRKVLDFGGTLLSFQAKRI